MAKMEIAVRIQDMEEFKMLMDETSRHYEAKMAKQFEVIQKLKNRCVTLQNENKALRKERAEWIRDRKKKQHYKNGKRGTNFNG